MGRKWLDQTQQRLNKISYAEKCVARILDSRKIHYSRNYPVFGASGKIYFADFYLWHNCLIIEIDGPDHIGKEAADAAREADIKKQTDFRVIRFTNDDVFSRPWFVDERIVEEAPVKYVGKMSGKPGRKERKAMRKQILKDSVAEVRALKYMRIEASRWDSHLSQIARHG